MSAQHTPGPWRVTHQTGTDYRWDIVAPGEPRGEVVATCGAQQWTEGVIAANARLIASAPDLLAACEQMQLSLSSAYDFHGMLAAHRALDAAVAKARGEA